MHIFTILCMKPISMYVNSGSQDIGLKTIISKIFIRRRQKGVLIKQGYYVQGAGKKEFFTEHPPSTPLSRFTHDAKRKNFQKPSHSFLILERLR